MYSSLTPQEEVQSTHILKEVEGIFAWSYKERPKINGEIDGYKISLYPNLKLIKQKLNRMKLKWILKTKQDVQKYLDVNFLRVFNYSQ